METGIADTPRFTGGGGKIVYSVYMKILYDRVIDDDGKVILSKWHLTQSAREAFARWEKQKRERIERLKTSLRAKKEKLQREVESWKIVE